MMKKNVKLGQRKTWLHTSATLCNALYIKMYDNVCQQHDSKRIVTHLYKRKKLNNLVLFFVDKFIRICCLHTTTEPVVLVSPEKKHSDFLHKVWQRIMKKIFFPYRFIHPDSRLDICLQYLCTCNPYHRSHRASFRCRLKLSSQISCPLKVAEKILLNVSFSLITWGIVAN